MPSRHHSISVKVGREGVSKERRNHPLGRIFISPQPSSTLRIRDHTFREEVLSVRWPKIRLHCRLRLRFCGFKEEGYRFLVFMKSLSRKELNGSRKNCKRNLNYSCRPLTTRFRHEERRTSVSYFGKRAQSHQLYIMLFCSPKARTHRN